MKLLFFLSLLSLSITVADAQTKKEVLGVWWWHTGPTAANMHIRIYRQQNQYYHEISFPDGSHDKTKATKKGNVIRYTNSNGEYYRLLPNRNLGLYNRQNKQFGIAELVALK